MMPDSIRTRRRRCSGPEQPLYQTFVPPVLSNMQTWIRQSSVQHPVLSQLGYKTRPVPSSAHRAYCENPSPQCDKKVASLSRHVPVGWLPCNVNTSYAWVGHRYNNNLP